jgi:lipopolysaccharide biosynthesis protein
MNSQDQVKLISFYLPQFHPILENDLWWGKGFTEWTNVTKAKPLFRDHYQPHLPADLGFYDLRLPEARQAQAELAKKYNIYGFCYYHYWFNGKRLLERPFNEVLESGQPDFPFCLCWANENWTRRWDGLDTDILAEQVYNDDSDILHIQWLANVFQDTRYIRIDSKPLFLVYRASKLPNAARTTDIWRNEAYKLGIGDIFLCKVESFLDEKSDPKLSGFDASVEFQPSNRSLKRNILWRILGKLGISNHPYAVNHIHDYSKLVDLALNEPDVAYRRFPCITPSWDNSSRRKNNATIFHDSTPQKYEYWLKETIQKLEKKSDNIIFINAWNEWGEGNHLEPCQKWNLAYLEATQRAINSYSSEEK